ncbi:serine/threonine-protein kinase [Microbulbifer sp. SAOS-129_SWC]|uniref:serine/threonine-protein kinase n=1 Tax=Microbulbifer sp. SAOS-129_SWC TaxID=3145235 RepID=UPI0032177982
MESCNWGKIEALFNEALEQPDHERNTFLKRACDGDNTLRQAVESLLEQCTDDLPAAKIVENAAKQLIDAPELPTGTMLGAYRVIGPIGRGGMGDVYLGERGDRAFSKRVAIKLIRHHTLRGDDIEARFRNERQILAALEHPNIARLLDGGNTAEGIPYLVMEYIEGESITSYCQRHQLSLQRRLELFRKVCNAVDYAHQYLVVHRDIKPSNILVNTQGEPQLLDFGIAKVLENSSITKQGPETTVAALMLTPHYSSPEHLRGEPVSTASDVYALGVVLYELLTGNRPFEREETPAHAVLQSILSQDPQPPSVSHFPAGVSSSATDQVRQPQLRWARQLRGDLDNITLMALRREPGRRYQSASLLSKDIANYLQKRPVSARPASWGYLVSRFMSRNRLASAAMILLVAAIIMFGSVLIKQAASLKNQRDFAQQQLARAGTISKFLEQMFSGIDPDKAQGREITVREMLDHAAEQLKSDDIEAKREGEVVASLRRVIGSSYTQLGLLPEAEFHLQRALQGVRDGEVKDPHEQLRILLAVSDLYHLQNRTREQLALARQTLKLANGLQPPEPALKLDVLNRYASALQIAGDLEGALKEFTDLYHATETFYGKDHPNTLRAVSNLGVINHWLEHYDPAERYYRECYQRSQSVLGEKNTTTLACLSNLASLLETRGKFTAALPLLLRHIELAKAVLGEIHPETLRSMHNLADTYRGLHRYRESEKLFLQVYKSRKAILGAKNIETLQTQYKLGRLYALEQRYDEALTLLQASYRDLAQQLGKDHPNTLIAKRILDATLSKARQSGAKDGTPTRTL